MPETRAQELRRWRSLLETYPDAAEVIHSYADGWTVQRLQTIFDAKRVGYFMRNCWQTPEGSFEDSFSYFCTLNDADGLPRVAFYHNDLTDYIGSVMGMRNDVVGKDVWRRLLEWQPDSISLSVMRHTLNNDRSPRSSHQQPRRREAGGF